jgi:hypothetical protein
LGLKTPPKFLKTDCGFFVFSCFLLALAVLS